MDKIDGPYYFFKLIQRMRELLPPWMPAVGIEGGRINIVPVDFVVDAIDHIAHAKEGNKKAFHLVDPTPYRVGDVLNIFAQGRACAAVLAARQCGAVGLHPGQREEGPAVADAGAAHPQRGDEGPRPARRHAQLRQLSDALRRARDHAALKGTGIVCPRLEDYAYRLWDYWERNLDPDLFIDRTLKGQVQGKVVVITGGSSGIGLAAAHKIAQAGATTVIIARDPRNSRRRRRRSRRAR